MVVVCQVPIVVESCQWSVSCMCICRTYIYKRVERSKEEKKISYVMNGWDVCRYRSSGVKISCFRSENRRGKIKSRLTGWMDPVYSLMRVLKSQSLLLLAEDYVRVWLSGDDGVLCKGKIEKKKEGIIGLPLSLFFTIVCIGYSLVVGADYSGGWWWVMKSASLVCMYGTKWRCMGTK